MSQEGIEVFVLSVGVLSDSDDSSDEEPLVAKKARREASTHIPSNVVSWNLIFHLGENVFRLISANAYITY